MEKVLLVGQTPPPVNGQTVMIQGFLDGQYEEIDLRLVRMTFSRSIDEVGTFQWRKLLHLFGTWWNILRERFRSRATVLYYPPAGPTLVPVLRDIFLLIGTRWMFRYTVFHFHAAGLPEIYPRLPRLLRPLYNLAYRSPDLAIFASESTSSTGRELGAKAVRIIANGIPDAAQKMALQRIRPVGHIPCILFMGILCEGKGLIVLIEACALLKRAGALFRVVCAGAYDSATSAEDIGLLLDRHDLTDRFHFPGVVSGDQKWGAFQDADIFCFPSHYYAESFGVVLIEAMCFQLPIVTTRWRGIPGVVGGSGGAFLAEPKHPDQVAERLLLLLNDPELRTSMGRKNRDWFLEHSSIETYRRNLESAILSLVQA